MSDAIVYLEDVTVAYEGFKALDRLNFYMDRRELRVVIGPNGAGKTTLLDVISGRVKPEHGRVIFGRSTDLTTLSENQIAALGIGRKFQTPSVFVNLTVWENVELSLRRPSKGVLSTLLGRDGAGARPAVRRPARDVLAAEHDTPGPRRQQAHDGAQHGRLPDAVAPHEADDLALRDREVHATATKKGGNLGYGVRFARAALSTWMRDRTALRTRLRPEKIHSS